MQPRRRCACVRSVALRGRDSLSLPHLARGAWAPCSAPALLCGGIAWSSYSHRPGERHQHHKALTVALPSVWVLRFPAALPSVLWHPWVLLWLRTAHTRSAAPRASAAEHTRASRRKACCFAARAACACACVVCARDGLAQAAQQARNWGAVCWWSYGRGAGVAGRPASTVRAEHSNHQGCTELCGQWCHGTHRPRRRC
jgi:hypothetical protein